LVGGLAANPVDWLTEAVKDEDTRSESPLPLPA
jgi:hypothetical protein